MTQIPPADTRWPQKLCWCCHLPQGWSASQNVVQCFTHLRSRCVNHIPSKSDPLMVWPGESHPHLLQVGYSILSSISQKAPHRFFKPHPQYWFTPPSTGLILFFSNVWPCMSQPGTLLVGWKTKGDQAAGHLEIRPHRSINKAHFYRQVFRIYFCP